jgi:phosphatidylserine/phosphatidylglycerophosphate/cardiolipin synthase-like enzyme
VSLARDLCEVERQLRDRPDVNLFAPGEEALSAVPECGPLIARIAQRGDLSASGIARLCLQALSIQHDDMRPRLLDAELVATLPSGTPGIARPTQIVVRQMIEKAKREVVLLGYELTDQALVKLLVDAKVRGVEVVLICDREKAAGKRVLAAWPGSVPPPRVFQDKARPDAAPYASMHAKSLVIDGEDLLITSANFTFHGLAGNIEIGVRLSGSAAVEARKIFSHLVESGVVEQCR